MNELFKALADPTRRQILELLKAGNLSAGEIAERFAIGKPAISHHLAILKAAELVEARRSGQNIIYSLNTTVFQDLVAWVYSLKTVEEDGT